MLKSDAGEYPVIDGNTFYFSGKEISASVLNNKNKLETLWKIGVSAKNDLIKAGNFLYAADSTGITAVRINSDKPEVIWSVKSNKPVERLIASNGKLIAVSGDGTIMVYGNTPSEGTTLSVNTESIIKISSSKADQYH